VSQYPALVAEPTWVRMPTKFAFSILNGSTPSSSEVSYWNGDIFWATPEDIGAMSGKVLRDTRRKITEAGYQNSGTRLAPPGSIVLTTRAPVGNLAIAGIPLCTNQGCKTLVPNDAVDASFAYYQFQARRNELEMLAAGTTFQELSSEKLSALELWLPPLADQRAIAAYLDVQTAKLDELIATKQYLLDLLAEKRQALITHAVTRGLDPAAPLCDSGVPWLGKIPAHWEMTTLRRVLSSMDYGISESVGINGNVAILRMGDILNGAISYRKIGFVDEVSPELLLEPGDLLFNRTNSLDQVGKVGLFQVDPGFPVSFASYLVRLRCNELVLPKYLNYLLNSPYVVAWARSEALPSIGQANLNPNRYSYLPIPLPPLQEQLDVIGRLDNSLSFVDDLQYATTQTVELLQERRSTLIAAAVTGQIDVTEPSCN
jgi:type I restriction enzyme S subunit